jgi:hypothetical protein
MACCERIRLEQLRFDEVRLIEEDSRCCGMSFFVRVEK